MPKDKREGFRTKDFHDAMERLLPGIVPEPADLLVVAFGVNDATAYRSPEPGSPPFVEIGARVTAGQTLVIIEAMKTMNQIPSPRAGTVIAILVEDGQPVEYGEPLAVIEQR